MPEASTGAARRGDEIRERFDQAVAMLHMREFGYAVIALQRVIELRPDLPEAHVNLGFALLGLDDPAAAQSSFEDAIGIRRDQANAYYGLAVALHRLGDITAAIGAMETYLHLDGAGERYRRNARQLLEAWRGRPEGAGPMDPER